MRINWHVDFDGPVDASNGAGPVFAGFDSPVGVEEPRLADLLTRFDYVEVEYFVSGTVRGQPFRTTLLVRKPADLSNFSGVVALEPVHLQGALGLWQTSHSAILRGGHIWMTLGSQRGALEGPIKMVNPTRYSALNVPEAKKPGQRSLDTALAEWGRSTAANAAVPPELFHVDAISNEIMTVVGAALKGGSPATPLSGYQVDFLLMAGASQTGLHTLNFIEHARETARLPSGAPIYDGYLPMAAPSQRPVAGGDAAVIHIFAEGDFFLFNALSATGYSGAREDSDALNDRYRSYQVAAASHLPTRGVTKTSIPSLGITVEPHERFTQFPSAPFCQGAFVNLVNWVKRGVSPPRCAALEIGGGQLVRDTYGNARGGLRSPYVDVPSRRYVASRYLRHLVGVEIPFSPEELRKLYGSRATYLDLFNRHIDELVARRWLMPDDGEVLKREETESSPF